MTATAFAPAFAAAAPRALFMRQGGNDDFPELGAVGVKVRFARNETIFSEGDEAKSAYRVVKGAVRLCRYMADGRRQIADFLCEGDLFGFMQFGLYGFSAEAVGEVEVIAYPQRQVERIAASTPELRRRLLVLLSQRLRLAEDHLLMLGRQTAKERVASFLVRLSERKERITGGGDCDLALPMSRQDVADYLGLTIETVCRVLSAFKRSGAVTLPDLHRVVLKDRDALAAIAEGDEEI